MLRRFSGVFSNGGRLGEVLSLYGIIRVKNRERIRKTLHREGIRERDLLDYRDGRLDGFLTGHNPYKETTDLKRSKPLLETNGVTREFYPDTLGIVTRKRREEVAIPQ